MTPSQQPADNASLVFTKLAASSYGIVAGALILAAWLHLGTLLVTVLFSLFALKKLFCFQRRWLAVTLFTVLVVAALYGFGFFLNRTIKDLPDILTKTIPHVVSYAESHGFELPFSDLDELKETALKMAHESGGYLTTFAKNAAKESVMLIAGIVIAIGIFVNHKPKEPKENLYTHYAAIIRNRFRAFYHSFETVMGAQLFISLINTVATTFFVLATDLRPYAGIVIPLTFICGMLPIVGNLVSNIFIVAIAFGLVSPQMALGALVFLVVVHKMEYLLNSKIIGGRIRHPMWMTLIALILGEYIMGIPGVILAPVVLNFLKVEGSRYAVSEPQY